MCPYVSNTSCLKMPKASGSLSSDDSSEVSDSKNCKLCRKKLHNSHFFNPKSGSLFSVCDICRKKKRDKYWRTVWFDTWSIGNKELLQQSTIDTRQSTRSRQYRQRESLPPKTNESATTSPTCSDLFSIPVPSGIRKTSNVCSVSNGCPREADGKLILVPPHVSNFIWTYRQNPAYIRSYLGDYYWSLLCEPNVANSSSTLF